MPSVTRDGALTRAHGPSLAMLEWTVGDDWDGEGMQPVLDANPASWITLDGLAEQRAALQDSAFRRYHANQWTVGEHHGYLPVRGRRARPRRRRSSPGNGSSSAST